MTAQQFSPDSALEQVHKTRDPEPVPRNAVQRELIFFAGLLVVMLAAQVAGFFATYNFLATTSRQLPHLPPPPPPVMVQISQ